MLTSLSRRKWLMALFVLCVCGVSLFRFYASEMTKSKEFGTHESRTIPSNVSFDAMVLTYMRSGSSFVGQVIGFREDSFYWYEPLWKLHTWEYMSNNGAWCNYKNNACRTAFICSVRYIGGSGRKKTSPSIGVAFSMSFPRLGTSLLGCGSYVITDNRTDSIKNNLQFLLNIYKCEQLNQHYDRLSILQRHQIYAGPTGAAYENCNRRLKSASEKCFMVTMDRCTKAKHRVTKVLRMSATHAQSLLERHERLKIIHVFRDPRAVIYSRIKTKWYYRNGTHSPTTDAQTLCKRMSEDIDAAEQLRQLYPDRVKIIQYEDFYDPQRLAGSLYAFLNMKMTSESEKLIKKLTTADEQTRKAFHPDSYRFQMDWSVIESVEKACSDVIKQLGLRTFGNRHELMNTTLSVVTNVLPYTIE